MTITTTNSIITTRPKLTVQPGAGTKMPESRYRPDSCPFPPPFWVSVEPVVKPSANETLFSDVLLLLTTSEALRRELLFLLLLLLLLLPLLLVLLLSRVRPAVPATAGTLEIPQTPEAPGGGATTTKATEGRHTRSTMMVSFSRVIPASGTLLVAGGPPLLLPPSPRINPTRTCCHLQDNEKRSGTS